jgi:type II secretion system protein N
MRRMRNRVAVALLLVLTACSSKKDDKAGAKTDDSKGTRPGEQPSLGETGGAFKLSDVTSSGDDGTEVKIDRKGVPLRDMDLAAYFGGLPLSGMADIAIDLKVPKSAGAEDFRQAKGTITIACPNSCQIGDDQTKLSLNPKAGAMGELSFGHLLLDKFEMKMDVADGHAKLSQWEVQSNDVTLQVTLDVELGRTVKESKVNGCVRFKPSDDLAKRDPKTATVLSATGATRGADGMYSIKLEGTVGHRKAIGMPCGS